jgi:hypothetical protein
LLEAAVSAAHSGCENKECRFHGFLKGGVKSGGCLNSRFNSIQSNRPLRRPCNANCLACWQSLKSSNGMTGAGAHINANGARKSDDSENHFENLIGVKNRNGQSQIKRSYKLSLIL